MSALDPIVLALPDTDDFSESSPQMQALLGGIASGRPILAVVGASQREELAALTQANALPVHAEESLHAWVRTEPSRRVATAIFQALEARGITATVLDVGQVGPSVHGPTLDATPRSIHAKSVIRALSEHEVTIIPGGCGRTDEGTPAIVGDGSVLLTALFVADRLAFDLWLVRPDKTAHSAEGPDRSAAEGPEPWFGVGIDRTQRRAALFARRHRLSFRLVNAELAQIGTFDPDSPLERLDETQSFLPVNCPGEACLTRAG
ncbi:MAG: hypothetical protein Kow0022_14840 [Phycisphaerales bacterium]